MNSAGAGFGAGYAVREQKSRNRLSSPSRHGVKATMTAGPLIGFEASPDNEDNAPRPAS
jgi:hypothetical protein